MLYSRVISTNKTILSSKLEFAGVDFLQVSCNENAELDLVHLGPVTNLAELGCDKQYRWMMMMGWVIMMMMIAIVMKSSAWFI